MAAEAFGIMELSDHLDVRGRRAALKADSPGNGDASAKKCPRGRRHSSAPSTISLERGVHDVSEHHLSTMSPNAQIWGISCAQTAIIPINSEIDAKAAASSTKVFNMPASRYVNIRRTLFSFRS
jgi:hypothetical protein